MKILQDIEDTGKSKGDEILFSDFDSARILADQNTLKKRQKLERMKNNNIKLFGLKQLNLDEKDSTRNLYYKNAQEPQRLREMYNLKTILSGQRSVTSGS